MAQLLFGSGALWGERTDNKITDPITKVVTPAPGTGPIQFGITQKASVNWSFTDKKVYGQQQFPIAIVRGQGQVDGKASNAQFNMLLFADLFFGLTAVQGQLSIAQSEVVTIDGDYTPLHAGSFSGDLGVRYNDTGDHFQRFPNPDVPGIYAVGLGTAYRFNAADIGREVVISYQYDTADVDNQPDGMKLTIINRQQGITPVWMATFFHETSPGQAGAGTTDQPFALQLNACVSSKLTLPNSAVDSWTIPDLDFEACADEDGNVGLLSMIQP